MLSFFRYTIRETGTNLWRNRLMTVAAILTVTVSLFLVGAALMLKQSASQASSHWQQGTRVTIWMQTRPQRPKSTLSRLSSTHCRS